MKLKKLKLQGIGCFHDEVELPIEALGDASIVCVRGLNGAGKSTLFECVPGLVYGHTPSRGLLTAMANRPDSFVEGVIETDQRYWLRRTINATRKQPKIEAYLFDGSDEPLNDGKQTTFDHEVARRFPSGRVYLASGYAAQNRGGQFLEVSKAERKALFAEMLGLGMLQALSERARERASDQDAERQRLSSAIATLQPRSEIGPMLRGRLAEAHEAEVTARKRVAELERDAKKAQENLDAWTRQRGLLDETATKAREAVLSADHAVERAQAKFAAVKEGMAQNRKAQDEILARLRQRDELVRFAEGEDNPQEIQRLESEIDSARNVDRARQEADAQLHRLEDALTLAERKAGEDLQTTHALADVPCKGEGVFSGCPLITRATSARDRTDANASAVEDARFAIDQQRHIIVELPRAPDTQNHVDRIVQLRAEQRRRDQARGELLRLDEACVGLGELEIDAEKLVLGIDLATKALDDAAEAQARAHTTLRDASQARAEHDEAKPTVTSTDLGTWRQKQTATAVEVGRLEKAVELACEAAEQIGELEKQYGECAATIDDWRHLQKALGRDGVQALEIDAAGPEVSELINELLHSCYGPRFTVALETTTQKKDGKGSKEVFDLRVIDTEGGTDGSASDLSGGERVIVAEALSLAIAIYNTQRSAMPIQDLFRDEVAGALDYENAPRYVAMLRRALELGSFARVYFVAHSRDLWDLADAQIVVADGKVEVAA